MTSAAAPTWRLVLHAARHLGADRHPVTLQSLLAEVQRMAPGRDRGSISPVIQGMTVNAGKGPTSPCGQPLERVGHGLYRLRTAIDDDVRASRSTDAPGARADDVADIRDVEAAGLGTAPGAASVPHLVGAVLVGCVKTKGSVAAAARDLYVSELFQRRRRYAESSGRPWFVVSARWGLLRPDEVAAPYDMDLKQQSAAYRRAWGELVVAHLEAVVGPVRGKRIEVHAGQAYVSALTAPLADRGAHLVAPVVATSMGATLAWYGQQDRWWDGSVKPTALPGPPGEAVRAMLLALLHERCARSVPDLLASEPARLRVPGMYSWWVDGDGAAELSARLGLDIGPGLVYAGQAGATRWPSGSPSSSTLWSRLAGMHASGNVKSSTFRRTLHAVLAQSPHRPFDEAQLSDWIAGRLRVIAVPWADAGSLTALEQAVLTQLDPPLNLAGMRPTPLRNRLKQLRSEGEPDPGLSG